MSNPAVWLLRGPILLYRMVPKRTQTCRYYPSCSEYSLEALAVHGAVKGTWLTIRRLLRCHPWGGTGIDRVPPKRGEAGVTNTSVEITSVADTSVASTSPPSTSPPSTLPPSTLPPSTSPPSAAHTPPGGPSVHLEEQY